MGNVFVVGDMNVDVLLYIKDIPKKGEEMHADKLNYSLGGNAANFAFSLSTMGMKTELHSAIGTDFSAELLRKVLKDAGVDARLKQGKGYNGYTFVMVQPDGERTFVSNKGICLDLTVKDLEPILDRIRPGDILYSAGLFHLPKLVRGFDRFLRKARAKGATTMLDFTFDSMHCSDCFPKLARHLDMVFMNQDEARRLGKGSLDSSLKKISGMGVSDIIVKLGAKGSMFYVNGRKTTSPGMKIKAVDTCGSGDVFNAGFVMGFASGLNPGKCLALGNMAGAFNARFSGLSAPPREKVLEFIRRNKLFCSVK